MLLTLQNLLDFLTFLHSHRFQQKGKKHSDADHLRKKPARGNLINDVYLTALESNMIKKAALQLLGHAAVFRPFAK